MAVPARVAVTAMLPTDAATDMSAYTAIPVKKADTAVAAPETDITRDHIPLWECRRASESTVSVDSLVVVIASA